MADKPLNLNVPNNDDAVNPSRFKPFEYENNIWSVRPLAATSPSKLLEPTYWSHIAAQLKQGDLIRAFWEDATQYAEYIVLSVGKNAARTDMLSHKAFNLKISEKLASLDPANYKAEFITGGEKWRVMRTTDNEVMVKNLDTEAQAEEWIEENIAKKGKGKKAA